MANLYIDPATFYEKDIFALMGLQNAPEDKKRDMLADMTRTIQNRVLARILDNLDEDSVKEFEQVLDENNEEKTKSFLMSHEIDLTKLTAEEAMIYKTEMINLINQRPQEG